MNNSHFSLPKHVLQIMGSATIRHITRLFGGIWAYWWGVMVYGFGPTPTAMLVVILGVRECGLRVNMPYASQKWYRPLG